MQLELPKFKMEHKLDLSATLQTMGVKEAFASKANFSKMNGHNDLFISAVIHKAFIEVSGSFMQTERRTHIA